MKKFLRILVLATGFVALFQSTKDSRLRGQDPVADIHDCIVKGDTSGYSVCGAAQYSGGSIYYLFHVSNWQ